MKYLRNLPLGLAALAQVCFDLLVLIREPLPGWYHEEMKSLMLGVALAAWLPLLVAAVGAVFTKVPRGPRRVRMLAATAVIAVMLGASMVIALSGSAAVAGDENAGIFEIFRVLLLPLPTIGGMLVPLLLIAWLGWLINAPLPADPAAWARPVIVAALLLTLPGGVIGTVFVGLVVIKAATPQEEWIRVEEQKQEAFQAAQFASLTDASPLYIWAAYATSLARGDQKERRPAALRRLASRPTLEPDIATDLVGSDRLHSDMAFLLAERVQFAPSPALEAPLRGAIARIVAEIHSDGDVDEPEGFFGERLAASLVIAIRMANVGVDLRDALRDLQSAMVEAYPKTREAYLQTRIVETYQRNVAATDGKIEAILSARRKTH
jgi:hypothetical protein